MVAKKYKISIAVVLGFYTIGYIPMKAVNVSPGATFSVSISCANVEGAVRAEGENATIASISNNWCDRGANIKITAKALQTQGVAKISLVGVDAAGNANTPNPENYAGKVIGSSLVNVVSPRPNPSVPNIPNVPNEQPNVVLPEVVSPSVPNRPNVPNVQPKPQTQPQPTQDTKDNTTIATDNTLSSLTISTGTLQPAFSPSVSVYNLIVTDDVKSITVGGKPKSAKATVSGIGEVALKAGKHAIVVRVKAENGAMKEYTINVIVNKKSEVYVDYNGVKLGVVSDLNGVSAPTKQFEKTTIKLVDKDITAWKNNVLNKTIVYLVDETTGIKSFYIYNPSTNKVETIFKPMSILGQNFYIVDVDKTLQNREGMKFGTVKIDKDELQGWTYKDAALKNYALIYVMDEKGEMVYYQYEDTEKTLQLYPNITQPVVEKKDDSAAIKKMEANLQQKDILIYVLVGVSSFLLGGSIVCFFRKGKKIKHQKINVDHKTFDDGFHIEKDALEQDDEK